jgi:hypothetical protein
MADDYRTIQRQKSSYNNQNFKRVALVIGNDRYEVAPLSNAVYDASAMKNFLETENFKVISANNADEQTMKSKVTEFLGLLNSKSVGFVYYSGHGIQEYSRNERRTVNYLIPTNNAQFRSLTDLDYHALSLNYILDSLSEKQNGLNIVLLDACRTPFKAFSKSPQVGLAPSNAQGVYIAYATASGDKALDNSLFRKSFIKHAKKSLRLVDIFEKVKMDVYSQTHQVPFISNGKIGSFYFRKVSSSLPISFSNPAIVKSYQSETLDSISSNNYLSKISNCEKIDSLQIVGKTTHNSKINGGLFNSKNNLKNYISYCNNGQASYCNKLGFAYYRGKILEKDDEKSIQFYKKGCSLGHEWSCLSLAVAYNNEKSISIYRKLCKNNHRESCTNLGHKLSGKERESAYKKGCDLGDKHSCASLANYYKEKTNRTKDDCSKSLSLYEKFCEDSYTSTHNSVCKILNNK